MRYLPAKLLENSSKIRRRFKIFLPLFQCMPSYTHLGQTSPGFAKSRLVFGRTLEPCNIRHALSSTRRALLFPIHPTHQKPRHVNMPLPKAILSPTSTNKRKSVVAADIEPAKKTKMSADKSAASPAGTATATTGSSKEAPGKKCHHCHNSNRLMISCTLMRSKAKKRERCAKTFWWVAWLSSRHIQ